MVSTSNRLLAYDRARALAIIGMIFVNATHMMGINDLKPWWAEVLISFITGRAAAIFVMLAGAGMAMAYHRAPAITKPSLKTQMLIRAAALCMIGFLLMIVWDADILHFYTAYIIGGLLLLERPTRRLNKILVLLVAVSMPISALATYENEGGEIYWLPFGQGPLNLIADYLFLNEYYPVLPWFCFFLVGMLLGRLERSPEIWKFKIIFVGSIIVFMAVESLSAMLNAETVAGRWFDIEMPGWRAFSLSEAFPAGPLFFFSAGASSLALISFLRLLPERTHASGFPTPMVAFGRLSLTFYISHILVGYTYNRWAVNQYGLASSNQAVFFATIFILAGLVFANRWLRYFKRGPLETVVNALTSVFLKYKKGPLQPAS
jgi:uncharacterized membrane protein YeiB